MSEVILLQSPPPKLEEVQKKIFSVGALEFLANLHKEFDEDIDQLYKNRRKRSVELHTSFKLDFKKSPERLDRSWTIAPLPFRLQNRHLDLGDVSASNTAHFESALNTNVQGIQVDFDDGHCPTWRNQLLAFQNIYLAVNGKLHGAPLSIKFLLPDRNKYVNMDRHFLSSYMRLVIATCHARAAPATGGMAAATLRPGADAADKESKEVINKILDAKLKEIEAGVDGFMVYDSRVVPHVNEITAEDLLTIPSGGVTLQGLRHNVAVSIMFIYHWLAGIGHFFYNGNVEDSATAEISRTQIWQWIRFAPFLEDDPKKQVTAKLVEKAAASFSAHAHKNLCRSNAERKRLTAARYMSIELFLARNPPEFITSYLNDNHKFRTLHNKALLSNL
ncbi:hypothetical protein MSG28_009262 [Choristoneura fumiferana]|uniref:Uncharacterized protein n=1 Tax=Choristoneura fumiferana TaxID=7141 RepID=A0ACC0KXA7_CHOFU|nr:hypothetical protein MSG28_009262 [Choristoneura fumiferana]